ncbi:MAG: hypothetical protein O7C39_02215, partial [Bacteroidetes bacterium]|nr:hypothetical protein [Bacteroidota bacterium]
QPCVVGRGHAPQLGEFAAPYLSSLYQWKMSLDSEKQSTTQTSDDLSVAGYHIVTGEKLEESPN